MSLELSSQQLAFEAWISTTKYNRLDGVWKPELDRYTVMCIKQILWETWLGARGIPYTYKSGFS